MRRPGVRAIAALVALTSVACVGSGGFDIPVTRPGAYDALSGAALARLAEARADWDAGELRIARARLLPMPSSTPRHTSSAHGSTLGSSAMCTRTVAGCPVCRAWSIA